MGDNTTAKVVDKIPEVLLQRSLGGGLALAALFFFLYRAGNHPTAEDYLVLLLFLPLGIFTAYLSYELAVLWHSKKSQAHVMKGFNKVLDKHQAQNREIVDRRPETYSQLKLWRIQNWIKEKPTYALVRANEHMDLRQTLTYLWASSIAGILIAVALWLLDNNPRGFRLALLCSAVAGLTTIAHIMRSHTYGKSLAYLYLSENEAVIED